MLTLVAMLATLVASRVVVAVQAADPWTGPDVVHFTPEDALVNPTVLSIQGSQQPDGSCRFDLQATLPKAGGASELEELARNLTTCESLVERGLPAAPDPSPMAVAATQPRAATTPTGLLPQVLADCSNGQVSPGTHCTEIDLHVWYHDPLPCSLPGFGDTPDGCLHVNDVYTALGWQWDGSTTCPGLISEKVAEGVYSYFFPTGWSLDASSLDPSAGDCTTAHAINAAQFSNHAFCPTVFGPILGLPAALEIALADPTVTSYNPVTVYGYGDGTASIGANVSASGPCERLLSFNYRVEQIVDGQPVVG